MEDSSQPAHPVLALCLYIAAVECLPWFQTFIPNGSNVPNPCTPGTGDIWGRVGHKNRLMEMDTNQENTTNQFGEDFRTALNKADAAPFDLGVWFFLCEEDSDGDTRSNGEELGDPLCMWSLGDPDPSGTITHPGIPDTVDGTVSVQDRAKYCGGA